GSTLRAARPDQAAARTPLGLGEHRRLRSFGSHRADAQLAIVMHRGEPNAVRVQIEIPRDVAKIHGVEFVLFGAFPEEQVTTAGTAGRGNVKPVRMQYHPPSFALDA